MYARKTVGVASIHKLLKHVGRGRCTLEPHVPEAAALRAWWATREGDYAPNVPLPSLVAIDAVPSLANGTLVCVVAVLTDMGDVASKWNEAKAAETYGL